MPDFRFSMLFSPMPAMPSSAPASMAWSSASMLSMPFCFSSLETVFGPRPGMRSRSRAPAGKSAIMASSAAMRPVSRYWLIFSALPSPTPSISVSRPPAATCSMSSLRSRSTRATLR